MFHSIGGKAKKNVACHNFCFYFQMLIDWTPDFCTVEI